MSIDLTKSHRQYRFNVSCGYSHPEWDSLHLFKTKWQDLGKDEARKLFNLLCDRFPESKNFYVTASTRLVHPISLESPMDWQPKTRKAT